jgi:hypothetical protein
MQFPGAGKPPLGVIFDSAMGEDIGEALALALLFGLDGKQECRVVGMAVSKSNIQSAAFVESVARFYAGTVSAAFASLGRSLPVGMNEKGLLPDATPMLTAPLSRVSAKGDPIYNHGIHKLVDTADPQAVLRNALTAQHDGNAVVLITGPATNFAGVLAMPDGKSWIERKARLLVVAEGRLEADLPAAKKLFEEWPGPIVVVGREVGEALRYPGESIERDFGWTTAHPVVDAYRAAGQMPYDAPAHAMAAALHAVRTDKPYFHLSESGTFQVGSDGKLTLFPGSGSHKRLLVDPAKKDEVVQTFVELVSAKPVLRPTRRPPPPKQQQAPPPPPPEAKPPSEAKPV